MMLVLSAIQAFSAGASGSCTVYTKGHSFAPQYAALLNGAFAHSYDFDDTYADLAFSRIWSNICEQYLLKSKGMECLKS